MKVTISCRVDLVKRAVLDELAKGMNCDISHILNEAIDLYLKSEKVVKKSSFEERFNSSNLLLHERFPIRSVRDASWVVTEENALNEIQSRIRCIYKHALSSSDAVYIITDLKYQYHHTGILDWLAVENTMALYYRFTGEPFPFIPEQSMNVLET